MFISLSIAPLFSGVDTDIHAEFAAMCFSSLRIRNICNAVTYGFWQNKKYKNLPIRIISVLTGTMRRQSQGWFSALVGGTLMLMSNDVENEDINKRILDLTSNNELL